MSGGLAAATIGNGSSGLKSLWIGAESISSLSGLALLGVVEGLTPQGVSYSEEEQFDRRCSGEHWYEYVAFEEVGRGC